MFPFFNTANSDSRLSTLDFLHSLFVLLFSGILLFPSSVSAADTNNILDLAIDADVGILDQEMKVDFVPAEAVLVLEKGIGNIQLYPAQLEKDVGQGNMLDATNRYLAGAAVPKELIGVLPDPFHYLFIVFGPDGVVAASTAVMQNKETLRKNSKIEKALADTVDNLKRGIEVERAALKTLDGELQPYREQAARIAGVDDIIDLSTGLARASSVEQRNQAEIDRLRELIDVGKKQTDPSDIYATLQELSANLQETAQRTAMTDRLTRSRREAAVVGVQQTIAYIREAKGYDREALARDVLTLRKRRKELEQKLNIPAPDESNQF